MKIQIYDTTLRDGTQRTDISLSASDKLNIARRLDDLGVAYIEGGWPGSNPKDAEFFRRAAAMSWQHAQITAFGATCAVDRAPQDDANLQALLGLRDRQLHGGGQKLDPARDRGAAHHAWKTTCASSRKRGLPAVAGPRR